MIKRKVIDRALKTADSDRLFNDIPLIRDTTELITPEKAEKMLRKNTSNRPINWNKVAEYRKSMENGEWKLHAQGLIFDEKGNLLTGQKRLWAIIYSGTSQYMRVSRGSPSNTADLIDRGSPQTSRDIASRKTERKHSPTEVSILRAIFAYDGICNPNLDQIAEGLVTYNDLLKDCINLTKGIKKTKERMMIMAVLCKENKLYLLGEIEPLGEILVDELSPLEIKKCWNKGAAFVLSMSKAKNVIRLFHI